MIIFIFRRAVGAFGGNVGAASDAVIGVGWSLVPTRLKIRNYFPRANETKRVNKHGWLKRMSTLGGRKIIMRRLLKGKHVLSH